MIAPKTPRPSKAEECAAYDAVTARNESVDSNIRTIEWRRPQTESGNSRRGLTHRIGTSDWRAEMDSIRLCSVEGCDRKHEARGLCHTHYARAIRQRVIAASPRADLSERDSLMKSLYESGLSTTQVGERVGLDDSGVSRRLRNMGVEMRPRVRQRNDSSLTYSGAHMRVRSDRGRAQDHLCSCGAQAAQWAYHHDDPAEMHSELGAYSADPSRYDAMCVPCHKRSDLERIARAS